MKNSPLYSCILLLLLFVSVTSIAQPVIVSQPSDTSICTGESAGFSIIAINTTTYQWQEHDGNAWYDINESVTYTSGENTPNLLITDANVGLNGYQYRCYVKDYLMNTDTSDAAILFVNDIPVILSNPQNTTVCRDETAIFDVEAENITDYHWQENNGSGWQALTNNAFYQGVHSQSLFVYTITGMNTFKYRCILYNNSCNIPSGEAILYVNPLPIGYNLTGGGGYCEGEDGIQIGLSNSELNINYELLLNDITTGIVMSGTGSVLDFGYYTAEGIYSINAINGITTCTNQMNGTTEVVMYPLPEIFNITGGGEYCEEGTGEVIGLDNSELNVQYELFLEGETTGITVLGTGSEISFGYRTDEGIYTVSATNINNTCTSEMDGIAEIIINDLPVANSGINFSVTFGTSVNLTGGTTGGSGNYSYSWSPSYLFDDPNVQYPTTINLISTTIFTLTVIDEITGCISHPDTILVTVTGGPLQVVTIANPDNICKGDVSKLYALTGGGTGYYEYEWTSDPTGFTSNEFNPGVSPEQTTKYIVTVSDGMNMVSDSIYVFVNDPPIIYNVTGGGIFCEGSQGVEIGLDNSELNVFYEVFFNAETTGLIKAGTGISINLGRFTQAGSYQVLAYDINCGCESLMNGSASITDYATPCVYAGEDQHISSGSSTSLNGFSSGGSGEYSYSWSSGYLLSNPYIQNPSTIALNTSALFTLISTDQNTGCISQPDSVIIFVGGGNLSLELFTISNYVCVNDSLKILALPSGGSGYYTYSWTSNPVGFNFGKNDPIVCPDETTTYYVSVNDGINTIIDSITIFVDVSPEKFNITGGGGYCPGSDGVVIGCDGSQENVIYELYHNNYPTGITIEGNGEEILFENQTTTGNYSIIGRYISSSCETPMNGITSVFIHDLPLSFSVSGENIYCDGSDGVNIELSASQTGINYELILDDMGTGIIKAGTGFPIIFSNQTSEGVYSVKAVNQTSFCSKLMHGQVEVVNRPSPQITASNDTTICAGSTINIYAESDENNFIWNTTPPSYSNNIFVSPVEDTIYNVFTFNDYGCIASAEVEIDVNESPEIFAEHNLSKNSIYVDPQGYVSYEFIINNEIVQNSVSNEYILPESIKKGDTIFVIVKNIFDCFSEDYVVIETLDNINAFSPNGDGINDVFLKDTEIIVFNRWGLKLFEGIDGWDGRYNGKLVAPGTYYYVHNLKDINGKIIRVIKGSVTVVRQ